jgi:DNA adenine methylase
MYNTFNRIENAQKRLEFVLIENLPFNECIRRYDSPETFFYCDPPYTMGVGYDNFGVSFKTEDHQALKDALGGTKGKWLLSYNDCPMINDLYDGFHIEKVTRINGLNRKNIRNNEYREVLIRNYSL